MSALISDEYLEQLRKMREIKPNWGNAGERHAQAIVDLADDREVRSIIDYGCGHGVLLGVLARLRPGLALQGYDPGMPQYSALPARADMLVSTDVLEHIEPDRLLGVMGHIRSLAPLAYINVHTGPARAVLPDGRNAHLIQKPAGWWELELRKQFDIVERVPGFSDARPSFLCE